MLVPSVPTRRRSASQIATVIKVSGTSISKLIIYSILQTRSLDQSIIHL